MNDNCFDPARPRLMAHVVAGFPSIAESFSAAAALAFSGAAYLEVQFPFSDPSADGPVIQSACVGALNAGFKLSDGFGLVSRASKELPCPIFIMSYASPVFRVGVREFCRRAKEAGARGLIIPDLCLDADEGLYEHGREMGLSIVPVIAPGLGPGRLERILSAECEFLYVALRTGITGEATEIGPENLSFLKRATSGTAKILAGFGIRDGAQIKALSGHVHAAIIGSAFSRIMLDLFRDGRSQDIPGALGEAMASLGVVKAEKPSLPKP